MIALHETHTMDAYPLSLTQICLRLRLSEPANVQSWYRNKNKADDPWHKQTMECMGYDGMLYQYETILQTKKKSRYLIYMFQIINVSEQWLCAHGLCNQKPVAGFYEYLYTQQSQLANTPIWAHDAVIYQIFPDRFFRDESLQTLKLLRKWSDIPNAQDFWGGNLLGIKKKIPYLVSLGVEAVYLNPVFLSVSNHRYDIMDYNLVDPLLGTESELLSLADELHQNHIRLILDGVFDHCGVDFAPFQDVMKNGENSFFKDWFLIDHYPIVLNPPSYEAIGYYCAMPKFCLHNSDVQEMLLNTVEYWTRLLHLDGWRLDVADELEPIFISRIRNRLRSINPNLLLIGEAWQENVGLVSPQGVDGLINYPLQRAMFAFFAKDEISAERFINAVTRALLAYPIYARETNVCMLDCHDTPRFWTRCNMSVQRLQCALTFLLLYPGICLIYYGDEIGLEGGADPDCRRAMPWDDLDNKIQLMYIRFIQLKKELRAGHVSLLRQYAPLIVLQSTFSTHLILSFINMGSQTKIEVDAQKYEVLFGNATRINRYSSMKISIELASMESIALKIKPVTEQERNHCSSILSTAKNASLGTSTEPN